MTPLRQFGFVRGNLVQDAARPCNEASQKLDEHPRSTKSNAFAKLFVPGFITQHFSDNRLASCYHLMH
jgi:hypothetical protein